jgi:hypothetical protein
MIRCVSPIPIKSPVVIAMPNSPAASKVASRAAGALSGDPWCGPPRRQSRSDALSSINPIDAPTRRRRSRFVLSMTPGFRCGSNPDSSSTSCAMRSR